mgnify:CR=1 FL=1
MHQKLKMSEIKKVLTTLNPSVVTSTVPGVNTGNRYGSTQSDKEVLFNKEGFLETAYPLILSPLVTKDVTTAAQFLLTSAEPIVHGTYLDADLTLPASAISPNRYCIYMDTSATAPRTWTLPSVSDHVDFLRKYCPAMCKAGLSYEILFLNQNATHQLSVSKPNEGGPESAVKLAFNNGASQDIPVKSSARIRFIITDFTAGAEAITYLVN